MSFEGFGGAPDKEKAALPAGLSHAVLICGGTEEERNKKALYIAKTAVCSGKKDAPCGVCRSCRKADEGVHPDIIIVKRPKDKKFFQKDAIKAVVENAYITPNEADLKVFVIEEVQYMTEECQNVLLKILEEPPSYTSFVLTSSNANAVIKTVLSRVTKIKLSASYEADAFSDKATEIVKNTLSALTSTFEFDVIAALSPTDGDKALVSEVLSLLCIALRDALSLKYGAKPLEKKLENETRTLSALPAEQLLSMYDVSSELLKLCESYPNYTLLSAVLSARLKVCGEAK